MYKLLLLYFFLFTSILVAQDEPDPFDKYGPPGTVYNNLKDALKEAKLVYKLKFDNQPADPKLFPKINKLTELQVLQLTNNGLTELPQEITELRNLIYFACIANEIKTLPKGFGNLEGLTELHIHSAKLDSLPYELAYCGRLKSLEIQNNGNDTFYFPNSFGYLANLNTLLLYNTHLDTLPSSFGDFKRLKSLTMTLCGIKEIPKSICKISSLELLVLDKNQISELPKNIYKLINLKYLSLENNKLTHIPDSICLLKNLEILDLKGNVFTEYDIAILKALLPKCRILI